MPRLLDSQAQRKTEHRKEQGLALPGRPKTKNGHPGQTPPGNAKKVLATPEARTGILADLGEVPHLRFTSKENQSQKCGSPSASWELDWMGRWPHLPVILNKKTVPGLFV